MEAAARENKSIWRKCVFAAVLFIALTTILLFLFSYHMEIQVLYRCDADGAMQVFYTAQLDDTHYFREDSSYRDTLTKTAGEPSVFYAALSNDSLFSPRLYVRVDFEQINRIELKSVAMAFIGIPFSTQDARQLSLAGDQLAYDAKLALTKDDYVLLTAVGNDPYLTCAPFPSLLPWILILSFLLSGIITYVLLRIRSIITQKAKPAYMPSRAQVLVTLFLLCIALPNFTFLFEEEEEASVSENRALASSPVLQLSTLTDFPTAFDAYYNDHLPMKGMLTKLNNAFQVKILNTSPMDAVILGKDGWLFYHSKYREDNDSLADYQCTNLFTDAELRQAADTLEAMRDHCAGRGISFCVLFCPDKSTIYPEYMPDAYVRQNTRSRMDQLVDYLRENTSLQVIAPKADLLAVKSEYQLYYKADTHWNLLGAYIAVSAYLRQMEGISLPALKDCAIRYSPHVSGDLSSMLNLNELYVENEPWISDYEWAQGIEEPSLSGSMLRFSGAEGMNKRLLIYRDSFSVSLLHCLTRYYQSIYAEWSPVYNPAYLDAIRPDTVIYQIVERSLGSIIQSNSIILEEENNL